jgi:hypothetical protein
MNIRNFKSYLLLAVILFIFASCKQGSEVSSRKFQKRKYTKGYHVNVKSPFQNKQTVRLDQAETAETAPINAHKIQEERISEDLTVSVKSVEKPQRLAKTQSFSLEIPKLFQKNSDFKPAKIPVLTDDDPPYYKDEPISQPAPATAILGFIFSIVGLFVAGIPLGIAAIILCGLAIGKISRTPGMKGRGLAIAGIIIGVIAIIGALIVISTMA